MPVLTNFGSSSREVGNCGSMIKIKNRLIAVCARGTAIHCNYIMSCSLNTRSSGSTVKFNLKVAQLLDDAWQAMWRMMKTQETTNSIPGASRHVSAFVLLKRVSIGPFIVFRTCRASKTWRFGYCQRLGDRKRDGGAYVQIHGSSSMELLKALEDCIISGTESIGEDGFI